MSSRSISIRFTESLTATCQVLILPVTSRGFSHPFDRPDISPSFLDAMRTSLSIGNAIDFGLRSNTRLIGVYTEYVCEQSDWDMMWYSLEAAIAGLKATCPLQDVLTAPLFTNPQSEFDCTLNRYFFVALFKAMSSGRVAIFVENRETEWVRSLLADVKPNVQSLVVFEMTLEENRRAMDGDSFSCTLCNEYVEDAVWTACCEVAYCLVCSRYVRNCPKCGKQATMKESLFLRGKVVDKLYVCDCHESMKMKDLKQHRVVCPFSQFQCRLCGLQDSFGQEEFMRHLRENHREQLLLDFTGNNR